jgi:hypothetical protein
MYSSPSFELSEELLDRLALLYDSLEVAPLGFSELASPSLSNRPVPSLSLIAPLTSHMLSLR